MPTLLVAHRGGAGLAPENTLAAFQNAVVLGVPTVELDVRLSRDGVPVCFHDDRLDRVTGESGPVSERDVAALRAIAVTSGGFGGAFPDARIPTLQEVLTALPSECRIMVELKADPARAEELVARTLETVEAAGARERCRIISFDVDLLRRARASGLPLGPITGRDAEAALALAEELRAVSVHLQHGLVNADLLRRARQSGFLVNAWTVNSAEEIRRLAALGVDEITTDYPDVARKALEES